MKRFTFTLLGLTFCLVLLIGCGGNNSGQAVKPPSYEELPKNGPVGAGGGKNGGVAAPSMKPPPKN